MRRRRDTRTHIPCAPGAPFGELAAAQTASEESVQVLELAMRGSGAVGAVHVGGEVSAVAPLPQGSVAGLPVTV